MSVNKIEGVPAGWELVRIGAIYDDEWFVNRFGQPQICNETTKRMFVDSNGSSSMATNYVIIRCNDSQQQCVKRPRNVRCLGWFDENSEQLDGTPCGTV